MAEIKVVRRSFGTIIYINGNFDGSDSREIEKWIEKLKGERIYFDLENWVVADTGPVLQFVKWLEKCQALGCMVTVGKANQRIREIIQEAQLDSNVFTLDFLDEALFQAKRLTQPRIRTLNGSHTNNGSKLRCPHCRISLAAGENECRQCGIRLKKRRAERSVTAIPFLYGTVHRQEFVNSNWIGAVTEDLDTQTFSGLGFFSHHSLTPGSLYYFVFPTLRWEPEKQDQSSLVIFRGRIKNCQLTETLYRIGVALIDLFQYQGRFLVSVDDELM